MIFVRSLPAMRYRNSFVTALVFLMLSLSVLAAEVPFEVQRLLRAAQQDIQGRNFDGAQEKYQAIIRKYPDAESTGTARGKLVETYLEAGKTAQAEAAVDEMMKHADASAAFKEALDHIGEAYRWKIRDHAMCREIYSRWLEKFSDDPEAFRFQSRLVQALVEGKAGDAEINRAIERFKTLCQGNADEVAVLRYLTKFFRDAGHPEISQSLSQWYIDTFSTSAQASLVYADIIDYHYLAFQNKTQADALLEVLMSKSNTSAAFMEALDHAGEAYRWKIRDHAKCREIYSRWLEKFSDDPEAFRFQSRLVQALVEGKAESAETHKAVERFKTLCQGKADVDVVPMLRYTAKVLRDTGHLNTALSLCQWYFDTFSASEQTSFVYADLIDHHYLAFQNKTQADALLEVLMARSNTSAAFKGALEHVGEAYRWKIRDHATCREIYSRWLEKFSDDPEAFRFQSRLVQALVEGKAESAEVEKAVERFKSLCRGKADADVAPVLRYTARILRDTGHPDASLMLYQWFVETFPHSGWVGSMYADMIDQSLRLNKTDMAELTLQKMMATCGDRVDFFDDMAFIGLAFRNRGLYDQSLKLYHWYTGLSAGHLDRFLDVYVRVPGFTNEVNDALDKSHAPQGKSRFLDQLFSRIGQSRNPTQVMSFYAEHRGGHLDENTINMILLMIGDNVNPPLRLSKVMDVFNRQRKGAVSIELCQAFLAHHPDSEYRPLLQLKLYESMLASGTEAVTIISYLDDYLDSDVPDDSDLIGRAITLKGQAYIHMAESAKAMACFRKVIQEYPQYPSTSQAVFFLGYCHLMANEFDKALQTLESLIKNYPDSEYDSHARNLLKRIVDMT
jgi:tetratricopeptide (TPR) repeat protein